MNIVDINIKDFVWKSIIILAVLRATKKRVTNGGAHLRGLAPEQRSTEETSQRRRVVGETLFDLTGLRIEPMISCADSDDVNFYVNRPVQVIDFQYQVYVSNFRTRHLLTSQVFKVL